MIKTCVECGEQFRTKDSRQKTCSKACADIQRRKWRPLPPPKKVASTAKVADLVAVEQLPDVHQLPAAYLKRCADLWHSLTGDGEPIQRIL